MKWRHLIASISLANLVYFRVWTEVLGSKESLEYWLKTPRAPQHVIALMINVVLLGLLLFCGMKALRAHDVLARWLAPVVGLLIAIPLITPLRSLVEEANPPHLLVLAARHSLLLGVLAVLLIVPGLALAGPRAFRLAYTMSLLLSPLVLLFFGQAVYRISVTVASSTADGPMAPRLPPKPAGSPRVVWVLFDEWDADLTFHERSNRIRLPEIDRLRTVGFSATHAETPGPHTDWSVPALTVGTALTDVKATGASHLSMRLKDSERWVVWSQQDNVFRKAREMGFNTAVVAWAVPYCRVLKADLSDCWWWSASNQYNSAGRTIPELLVGQPRSLYETIYRSPFGQSLATKRHIWVYDESLAKALEVVRDPGYGLVLLHLPVPHPPYFYSAATGRNDWADMPVTGLFRQTQQGYIDALVLTDRTVGMLRRAMEQAGIWERTTVIWSSDHPFRHRPSLDGKPVSQRVPYVIKTAGAGQAIEYESRFSSLITKRLIEAFLAGTISSPDQVARWIDAHRDEFPME